MYNKVESIVAWQSLGVSSSNRLEKSSMENYLYVVTKNYLKILYEGGSGDYLISGNHAYINRDSHNE